MQIQNAKDHNLHYRSLTDLSYQMRQSSPIKAKRQASLVHSRKSSTAEKPTATHLDAFLY